MSVVDDLTAVQSDLTTVQTAVSQAVTDLSVPATDSVGDQFLANAVSFLTGLGYTVTAPVAAVDDSATETPAEDATDPSTEA